MVSVVEPKSYLEVLSDPDWVNAMQEELKGLKCKDELALVPRPGYMNGISSGLRSKWIFRNQKDKSGQVVRNKARLMIQRP